eukprot:scaffold160160_cov38-Prasinocladus_malaysianus.AAC.1
MSSPQTKVCPLSNFIAYNSTQRHAILEAGAEAIRRSSGQDLDRGRAGGPRHHLLQWGDRIRVRALPTPSGCVTKPKSPIRDVCAYLDCLGAFIEPGIIVSILAANGKRIYGQPLFQPHHQQNFFMKDS